MTHLVFFYGTLMSGFRRAGRQRIDSQLQPQKNTRWVIGRIPAR